MLSRVELEESDGKLLKLERRCLLQLEENRILLSLSHTHTSNVKVNIKIFLMRQKE